MEVTFDILIYTFLFLTLYFEVFVLVTYLERRAAFAHSSKTPFRDPSLYPSVTIVVPAWNEENTIAGTIRSLLALDYPKEKLRVVVVDDGSTDGTLRVARSFATNPQVEVLSKPNGGKHSAMNLAIERADTDLIGCLDADSFVDPSALRHIVEKFSDPEVMAVTPSVQVKNAKSTVARMQAAEYMIGQFTRKIFGELGALYVTPGPFSIYRKEVFSKIGGFVHGFGTEDMEMALRMQSHRMRIENAHDALVYTTPPHAVRPLYRQRVRWVSGFLKNAIFTYRHMILNDRYGNLGLLSLPFAIASIGIALFFCAMYIRELLHSFSEWLIRVSAVGVHFELSWPTFDWFSWNLGMQTMLVVLLFAIFLFFLLRGLHIVRRSYSPTMDALYFIALYGFIAPFWLARSVYNLVAAKEAPWR